jgi:hypothetical protein
MVWVVKATPLPLYPSQVKVLIGGGDLRFTQVDVPLAVRHSCV